MKLTHEYTEDIESRFRYLPIIIGIFSLFILCRLYYLQVIRGNFYHFFSSENSVKELKVPTPRGVIYDRRGQVLAENRAAFDVVIIPQHVANPSEVMRTLSDFLSIPRETLEAIWEKRKRQPSYQELVVKEDIGFDEMSIIRSRKGPWRDEVHPYDLRGVEVKMRFERSYPLGDAATHLLGYIREYDEKQLEEMRRISPDRYEHGARGGIRGVERRWDAELRGVIGYEQRIVNAVGHAVTYEGIADQLEQKSAIPGRDLILTVDRDLQELARTQFGEQRGAAVMVDVRDGEILLLYSGPTYDLEALSSRGGSEYWKSLIVDPRKPLLNRPLQGLYPPASTYKVVTALAALEEGVTTPEEKIYCGGVYRFGRRDYRCWNRHGHGWVNLREAIARSCDVYFYVVGLRLGVDRIATYAKHLGLGTAAGIELSDERSGLIPTTTWKKERFGEKWQEGETLSIAVGQGYNLVTPLQNALIAARVANGGRPLHPKLIRDASAPSEESVLFDPEKLSTVRQGMIDAVEDRQGTLWRLKKLGITVGGKTGTAQVVGLEIGEKCREEWCRDHAWFIGFAPAEEPKVAVAVIVEHGGFGASVAAPIAGALLQKYHEIESLDTTAVAEKRKKSAALSTVSSNADRGE